MANFKVASTARRLDRDSGRWVDGNSLRVRVNCWRKLAEGVASSVMVGDPVVVAGRLYTRDWTDEAGNHRTLYEMEAVAVGHDLARGRGRFLRNRPSMATSIVEDAEAETRVHGEPTERVPRGQAPASPADRPFDEDFEPGGFDQARGAFDAPHVGRDLAGGPGFEDLAGDPFDDRADPADDELTELGVDGGDGGDGGDDLSPLPDGEPPSGDVARAGEVGPSTQGGHDDPEPSGGKPDGVTPDPRGRRGRGRVPVSA